MDLDKFKWIKINLDKYFKGTTIFTPFNTPVAFGASKRLDLYLNDCELPVVTALGIPASVIFCSSLLNCHRLAEEYA